MKKIYRFIFTFYIIALILSSCNENDENNDMLEMKNTPELRFSEDLISVIVGQEVNFEITQGGDEYNVFSLDPDIASAEIENNEVVISGKSSGNTFVIVSDQSGQYKKNPITAYYDKLILDQEILDVEIAIGKPISVTVKVIQGNGTYSAMSDKDDILSTRISGEDIIITALKEGDANVTVKDIMGVEAMFQVHISVSTNPYTEQELNEIKSNAMERYEFESNKVEKSRYYPFTYVIENDMNKYGWSTSWGDHLTIWFSGDKSVGKKEVAKLSQLTYGCTTFNNVPVNFEVIKNNGTKFWAVYSLIQDDKLYYGYLCSKINP